MNNIEIKTLAEQIEKHVGILLEDIEKQKKAILAKAKEEALVELQNAKNLSKEIIERTIQQTQNHLKEIKEKVSIAHPALNLSGSHKFIVDRSINNLKMLLNEINQNQELNPIEKNEPELEFW